MLFRVGSSCHPERMHMPSKPTATPASTRAELARVAQRGFTPVRRSFVQSRDGRKWHGSSLGRLVAARQPRALNAYLLLLMAWPALSVREVPLEAGTWARALSPDPPGRQWSPDAMTRVWAALEDLGLVERERAARLVQVTPRREDGAAPYARPRPDTGIADDLYFALPDDYWLDAWHVRLSLPGRALLLILLEGTNGRPEVALPYEKARDWYGISDKTMQAGLEDLRRHGLLAERAEWVEAPLSAVGWTKHTYYALTAPFSRDARAELQVRARAAVQSGTTTTTAS